MLLTTLGVILSRSERYESQNTLIPEQAIIKADEGKIATSEVRGTVRASQDFLCHSILKLSLI